MKLGHIELFVADPIASRDFYRDVLGFEVTAEQHGKFIWLRPGDQEILLRPGSGPKVDRYR
jgi:catechol 2,3-dioxygenase-like lactoylglutathione lyase family enzyme